MVSSRHRSSTASEPTPAKLQKPLLEEWTTREKLILASLAIKCGNAWNSVARNMQNMAEKSRPDGWFNQKTCAAQFDRLMNELGVDKRPKRNEPSDGNSSVVIYKKMAEKRIKELKESISESRRSWLNITKDIDALNDSSRVPEKSDQLKPKQEPNATPATNPTNKTPLSKANTSIVVDSDKPPTRALTRRESSRQNIEKTLAVLCKEASEIKSINLMSKPSVESEREIYDKVILKHVDISVIKKRLGSEIEDPFAVINDLLLMFQNATMFYPPEHSTHKAAVSLRDRLVPQWERSLLERVRTRH